LSCCLILTPALLTGCNSAKDGTVQGKVTVDGTPANGGFVVFTPSGGGQGISGIIQADGTYRAVEVPLGQVKVSVTPPPKATGTAPPIAGMEPPGGAAGKPVPIPPKYAAPNTSGLSTTVTGGTNTYDVALVSK
jgi:hypothetical protein